MKLRALALALSILLLPAGGARAAGLSPLHWDGHWIRDDTGRAVVLHGLNAVAKTGESIPDPDGTTITPDSLNDADATLIDSMGFNVVRLGLLWKAVEPAKGTFAQDYIDRAKQIVETLAAHGIYTLVDFHQDVYNEKYAGEGAPEWAVQSRLPATNTGNWMANYFTPAVSNEFDLFWANFNGIQDEYAKAWNFVAKSFDGNSAVLGYDLFNEPWPGTQWETCANPLGCPVFDSLLLQPFFQKVIDAVRGTDKRHIVFWEPNVTADFGAGINVGALNDGTMPPAAPQVGISFHDYCLEGGLTGNYATGATCESLEATAMNNGTAAAKTNGVAPLLTEFGAHDDLIDTARVADYADAAMIGWAYWAYKQYDDPTGGPNEALVTFNNAGEVVIKDKAAILARPYPQAVAGEPIDWRWDPGLTGTLSVVFDADPTLGETRIMWPAGTGSYDVHVACDSAVSGPCTDAHVTSVPGSRIISVVADAPVRVILSVSKR